MTTPRYQITAADLDGDPAEIGDEPTADTLDEALQMIRGLRTLGADWRSLDYSVIDTEDDDEVVDGVPPTAARCIYCEDYESPWFFDSRPDEDLLYSAIPSPSDDAAWRLEAERHHPQCEWVLTRAHSVDITS